jgi:Rrf2 family protein
MSTNSRFAVATHILTLLAQASDEPQTSEYIASSVNTNPVVIRRVLGALRAARLVDSQGGNGGGWRLLRSPGEITLRDVYCAVEDEALFALHHRPPNADCPVGRHIQQSLSVHIAAATRAMEDELGRVSVADVLREVRMGVA